MECAGSPAEIYVTIHATSIAYLTTPAGVRPIKGLTSERILEGRSSAQSRAQGNLAFIGR